MAENGIDVVFGGGPLGLAMAETLAGRGRAVRLVTRSGRADAPGGAQVIAADVSDPERAAEAARGAAAIYHCVGADYGHWLQLLPLVMAGAMQAAEATGARLVYGDNLYVYGPVEAALTEVLPSKATGSNGRIRTELSASGARKLRVLDYPPRSKGWPSKPTDCLNPVGSSSRSATHGRLRSAHRAGGTQSQMTSMSPAPGVEALLIAR